MNTEQEDLPLIAENAENIVGGIEVSRKSKRSATTAKAHAGYVLGDLHIVEPASSGTAGDDAESTDDSC